ncbi:MAG: helix-turn-helix domain-containing protein [Gammaproteobacteria bacterium]|uniref:hypothetical protein n=1 Tax=Stutzerimonas kunmingensis TaxID=1211807 RepID=UPI0028AD6FD4|nr:hypothetical protein [Stutzerimonas kunmingensis]MBU2014574.1 helix-turn-helix domain-containing protein [Gammaproteobacteria bacterium]
MATQLFAKTEKELSSYFAVYRELLTATGWNGLELVMAKDEKGKLVPTGEVVEVFYPLSCEDKVVWCWMLDRFQFFKEQNGVWFDNQDEIATYCGVGLSTVKRFIKKLVISGVLHVEKKPMGGARFSNSYVITRDLVLVQKDKAKAPVPIKEQPQQPIQAPQELAARQIDDFVPAGAGWASEAVPMDVYEDFVQELEDDGSCDDAFSYSEQETIQEPVSILVQEKEPATIHSVSLADMPSKRFQPNGDVSKEMAEWCARNNIKIFEAEYDVQFLFKGIPHVFNNNTFVPCSSLNRPGFRGGLNS